MSYNGSGLFQINTTGQPVVTGTTISSTAQNALTSDLATGLSTAICKDGQTTVTANIPFNGFKLTGVGPGTAATDAANFGQLSTFGVPGYTTTATAAGSTTLSVASTYEQYFTGVTTQTVVLPVTTTLVLGFQFLIVNNSSGVVTVNSSGSNLVVAMVANSAVLLTCILASGTTAASWDVKYAGMTSVTGTGNLVLATSPNLTSPTLTTPVIASIVNTGTLTLPTSTDTLVGRATTDTLTNKTLTSPVISSIVNTGTLTLPTSTDTLVGRATTDTLTNKTLSAATISSSTISGTLSGGTLTSNTVSSPTLIGVQTLGTTPQVFQNASTAVGTPIFRVSDGNRDCITVSTNADGTAFNAANCVLGVRQAGGTSRSINAAGTINASGADYAEYERKREDCGAIIKGQIVGFDADGLLTDRFSLAVSFAVKSTTPNLVGGDTWGNGLRECPPPPSKPALPEPPDSSDEGALQAYSVEVARLRDEFTAAVSAWEADRAAWQAEYEAIRAPWDRIAYCGKVPVNVPITSADVGRYIVAAAGDSGTIIGVVGADSENAVGRIRKRLADGRALVAVQ